MYNMFKYHDSLIYTMTSFTGTNIILGRYIYWLYSQKLRHISASRLYRPRDHRLSAKLVPTFAERGCHVVSMTDPYSCILGFLDQKQSFTYDMFFIGRKSLIRLFRASVSLFHVFLPPKTTRQDSVLLPTSTLAKLLLQKPQILTYEPLSLTIYLQLYHSFFVLCILFCPEDGGSAVVRNVTKCLAENRLSLPAYIIVIAVRT
jgi:hypothetical protein